MSTAIDLTFNCDTCNGDIAAPDIVERNSMQWRCPNCGDWNNWMKFTKEPNEVIEPITPQGNKPKCALCGHDEFYDDGICNMCGQNRNEPCQSCGVIDHSENISPELFKKFCDEIKIITQPGKWDLRDEDGDLHSPSWYIEAHASANANYMELHGKDVRGMTPEQEMHHMHMLDDALEEVRMYAKYVDLLFGYVDPDLE